MQFIYCLNEPELHIITLLASVRPLFMFHHNDMLPLRFRFRVRRRRSSLLLWLFLVLVVIILYVCYFIAHKFKIK